MRKPEWTDHTRAPFALNPIKAQVDAFDGPNRDPIPVCALLWPTTLRSEEETMANGLLFAAAPELLRLLEDATEAIDHILTVDPHLFPDLRLRKRMRKYRTATNKARGVGINPALQPRDADSQPRDDHIGDGTEMVGE